MPNDDETRPAMFLYLVSKLVIMMLPLAVFILGALAHFGLKMNVFTVSTSIVTAFFASRWYEQLTYEVYLYIDKKYR